MTNRMHFDFDGTVVLVTGGTSGIGHAVATAFATAGASVTVTGTRADASGYERDLSGFAYRQLEMRDHQAVDALAVGLGLLDVLVNNAGANFPDGQDEWEPDGFSAALDLNVEGAMRLTVGAGPALSASSMAGGASVVNLVSMTAFRSTTIVPGYAAAKAALLTLTRNLAVRWAEDGIRVNAVAPGLIDTAMTAPMQAFPELLESELSRGVLHRMGTAEEVAAAVLYLCSDASSYTTGSVLAVDGGYLARLRSCVAEEIRIDDLADPVLNEVQRMGVEYGETRHTELSVDAVCRAAVARTGLEGFGPDDFRERLRVQLAEMDADDERTGLGRMLFFGDCVRYASNRLRIHDLLARHPEILDVPIAAPVIVIGLPRSGTTHLVNLLAADTRFRSMPLWESYEPVPDPAETVSAEGVDARWTRCQQAWEAMQAGAPLVAAMHPMAPDHVHEEIELQAADFSSYNTEWIARAPVWRDYYLAHDQTPHYAYMKSVLQVLQWYRPRERWVLKSPQHLEQIGPLLATFPDATIVVTHRDPVAVVQSTITMLCYGSRAAYRATEPGWYRDYWTDRIGRLLDASLRDRHLLPEERTLDVLFHEYMDDEMGMLEQVYASAGIELTGRARAEIEDYRATHPRGKEGQVVYDLRRDFSTTPEAVRSRYRGYLDRFPVRIEVT